MCAESTSPAKIASLIGIEGGHQINNSLAVLRQMYDLGARYMTLTHIHTTDWADSATDAPAAPRLDAVRRGSDSRDEPARHAGRFEPRVARGHARRARRRAQAPVMFSHSSARAIVDHPRNVPDDILRLVANNGGVVMVNFFPGLCVGGAQSVGSRSRRGNGALRQPALRRALHRPAGARQGGARALGERASEAGHDALGGRRSHRSRASGGGRRPRRPGIGLRRHPGCAARPRGGGPLSRAARRADAPRLDRRARSPSSRARTCCA